MKAHTHVNGLGRAVSIILIAFISIFALVACNETPDSDAQVVIYGSDQCPICVALRGELDEAGVAYRFYDILADDEAYNEVVSLAQNESWWEGRVSTPTLWIRGDLYVRPSFDEVMTALGQ